MSSYACLLFICLMFPTLQAAVVAGGLNVISVDSPEVIRLTNYVLAKLNEGSNDSVKSLVEVLNASTQVVAGSMTRLVLKINENDEEKICEVSIWERVWIGDPEITDVKCDALFSRRKRKTTLKDTYDYDDIEIFDSFLKMYNKFYNSKAEYKRRYHIFKANMKIIKSLRERELGTGKNGATSFADLSSTEFQQYLGLKIPELIEGLPEVELPDISLLDEFDWKNYNVATPVKNQDPISVTGNTEAQWALKTNESLSLSEQELTDCEHHI